EHSAFVDLLRATSGSSANNREVLNSDEWMQRCFSSSTSWVPQVTKERTALVDFVHDLCQAKRSLCCKISTEAERLLYEEGYHDGRRWPDDAPPMQPQSMDPALGEPSDAALEPEEAFRKQMTRV